MLGLPLRNFYLSAFITLVMISCIGMPWSPRKSTTATINSVELCDPWDTGPQMVNIPVFSQAWQIVSDCDQHSREAVAIAMIFFYEDWQRSFDDDGTVWRALNNLMIEWSNEEKIVSGFDSMGRRRSNLQASGAALTSGMIWVQPSEYGPICETSLVHELVHIAIWNIKGTDGDPDHMGRKYSGWTVDHAALIQRVNDRLCSLGI